MLPFPPWDCWGLVPCAPSWVVDGPKGDLVIGVLMLLEENNIFLLIVKMEKPRPRDVTALVQGIPHSNSPAWKALRTRLAMAGLI